MRYTLRQLEVFLTIARTESVTRAAGELAMSQSAVSGALADFERQFDVQLFDRVGKRVQLSELGRSLRAPAQAVLEQARELEQILSKDTEAARLRVGATLTIGNYVAVPLMARFMRAYPGAEVSLHVANTATIARMVENFEIDVGLVEGELSHPDLEITPWRDDELVVFCATGSALAKKRSLTDEDLRGVSWIIREPGSGNRQAFDRAMHGLLPELTILLELQHTEAIKVAVEAGLGVGCLSRITVEEAFRAGSSRALSVPHRNFRRRFFFVLHRHKFRSSGIRRWLEVCRDETKAVGAQRQKPIDMGRRRDDSRLP